MFTGLILALFFAYTQKQTDELPNSFFEVAQQIVKNCGNSEHISTCYDEEIPKLMDAGYSMEDAFEATREVQLLDDSYQYCHVLGHYLAGKETAKDPNNWKDVVARAPLGVCSNGAVHGAFQEKFRAASLENVPMDDVVPELRGICEPRDGWEPTQMGIATCTHALGHLTMYVTNGDIVDSLELCDQLLAPNLNDAVRQLCYDGVFMQIFQPLEPEDFALIVGKEIETKKAATIFCSQFDGARFGSCVSEGWPLYRESLEHPETISIACAVINFDSWQYERCLNGMFYVAMAMSNLDVAWAVSFCSEVPEEIRGLCFSNSASRLIETDNRNVQKALMLCEKSKIVQQEFACYSELVKYSSYIFKVGSDEFIELCSGMPQPYTNQCFGTMKRSNT